jgi:tRNA pseudouridine55 synthase
LDAPRDAPAAVPGAAAVGDGLIQLDKPAGITSFQALGRIKRVLGTGKVGHAGTLDRFAEGLLLVLTGRMARLVPLFVVLDKVYEATFTFGAETETLDPEGEVVARAPAPTLGRIEEAVPAFLGDLDQVPPAFSAVHTGGRRAYQLARSGERPQLAPRRVTIHAITILGFDPPDLRVAVRCSKGTYIRALARDLGVACGSRAHVRALRRTAIGEFHLREAIRPERFDPGRHITPPGRFLERIPGIRRVVLPDPAAAAVRRGAPPPADARPGEEETVALFDGSGELLAVMAAGRDRCLYRAVQGGRR